MSFFTHLHSGSDTAVLTADFVKRLNAVRGVVWVGEHHPDLKLSRNLHPDSGAQQAVSIEPADAARFDVRASGEWHGSHRPGPRHTLLRMYCAFGWASVVVSW